MVHRKYTTYLVVVAATLIATVSVMPQTRTLAITRVNVLDVVDGRIVPNSMVTIRGNTIASVTQSSAPPADARVVDGQGKFLIPGLWDMHDELVAMVRGGMTPLAALQTATLNPAQYFGLVQTLGSVAPGQRADLVMLDANPLTDITNVRRIRGVVVAGRFLDRQELDKVLAQVRNAAKQ